MGLMNLFTSSWLRSPLLLFVLLIHLSDYCHGAMYLSYDITSDRVCNRFRKREMDVMLRSPVLIESRATTIYRVFGGGGGMPFSCTFEIEAKGGFRLGVVSVVQRMAFRSQGDYCLDYIQTVFKETKGIKLKHKSKKDKIKKKVLKKVAKTAVGGRRKRDSDDEDNRGPRICGDVLFGLHVDQNETMPPPFAFPLPPTAPRDDSLFSLVADGHFYNPYHSVVSDAADASDNKGELKTYLYISNRMLRVGEAVKLRIAYTAYQECDGRRVPENLFHCGYGMCISRELVDDGIVNCPFGDCIDETNCTYAKTANITANIVNYVAPQATSSDSGGTIGGLVSFLIISALIAFCCIYCCKKRKQQKSKTTDDQDDDEDKGAEFADPSKQPTQPNAGAYYPAQPPAGGYVPPPGGQPGYYPMVPQQPPPGYAPLPQQPPPPGYPGGPPQAGGGYPPYPSAQAPNAGYPGMAPYPYPPSSTGGPEGDNQGAGPPPAGAIGFNMPPQPGGYPPPAGYPPQPGAPGQAPTAPSADA